MTASQNKPFYKVISLFIKSVILFFSFYYLWNKLSEAPVNFNIPSLFSPDNLFLTVSIFLLMFANWGLEALKWKMLIAPLEKISLTSSIIAIFSGVTVSVFSPNRIGEFAGRVFFLKEADKIQASIMSIVGSLMQLLVTIFAGILAYFVLRKDQIEFFQLQNFISTDNLLLLVGLLIVFVLIATYIYVKRHTTFLKFKKYIETLRIYSNRELNLFFCLSFLRYIVFSVQYYFSLELFGMKGEMVTIFSLIAITFFVTSVIPTFALTEIAIRAGVAIYFFGLIFTDHSSIAAASLLLWVINLAVPAIIGSAFVWKLNLYKK